MGSVKKRPRSSPSGDCSLCRHSYSENQKGTTERRNKPHGGTCQLLLLRSLKIQVRVVYADPENEETVWLKVKYVFLTFYKEKDKDR